MKGIAPDIERILLAGNSAPSGENCQPWRFVVRGPSIEVHLLPERDQSAYSWGQRSSYLAHGAVIENLVIAASAEHYRAAVHYLPDAKVPSHTATVTLTKDELFQPDSLAPFVQSRISNRKPYARIPLTPEEQERLRSAASSGNAFVLVEQGVDLERLGRIGATNEEVMLGNRHLHRFFFSHVSWTKEQDEQNKVGFYIKTLELPPPAEKLFRVFRFWPVMRLLAALGFTRIVAKQNGVTNASASAIGAFLMDGIEPIDFLKLGRTVERFWIAANALGLSIQPLTGVLFFKLLIEGGEGNIFSPRERELIMQAYDDASSILGAEGKHIGFMVRIGHGGQPSAHAIRFPLEEAAAAV